MRVWGVLDYGCVIALAALPPLLDGGGGEWMMTPHIRVRLV